MRLSLVILFFLALVTSAFAANDLDVLYDQLHESFRNNPVFHNNAINDFRDGVESPWIRPIFGEYATNNARPLSQLQLGKLPEGRFLDKEPFYLAMAGRERLLKAGKIKDLPLLVVVDFSRHSRNRRLFIFDIKKGEVLMNTYTSHAYKSDSDKDGYADSFGNLPGSNLSSLGFMSTDTTYSGNYGYSLRVRGLDPALNSNVYARAMVFHGFGGMGPQEASWGALPTSEGCFMISSTESGRFYGLKERPLVEIVINTLKAGALVFSYIDENADLFKSTWIKKSDIPKDEEEVEEEPKPEEPKPVEPEKPKSTDPVEVEYVQPESDGSEIVSSHLPNPGQILNARPLQGRKELIEVTE